MPKPGRLASPITPQLYLSDYWTARNVTKLDELGITHVVSVLHFVPKLPQCIPADRRLHIKIDDDSEADILKHLEKTTTFIIAAISEDPENKVLVHCMMGASRSPTVVCAYLVATTSMTASETLTHVRSLRRIVRPNEGFCQQLEKYGTQFVKDKPKPLEIVMLPGTSESPSIAARIRSLRNRSGEGPQ